MILFIKQVDIEGPETFKGFFEGRGFETSTCELSKGDLLPEDLRGLDAVVVLGGPMNVYEEEKHPFLKDEHVFIQKVLAQEIPFIGICLGSQILAKAAGGKVVQSPEKEVGLLPVQLNENGKKDPLFKGLEESIDVFQWHEDMSELPPGAELLASSQGCPNQAFKLGTGEYALQFHIEVTEETIGKWMDTYFEQGDPFRLQQKRMIMEDFKAKKEIFVKMADTVYNNFLKIIKKKNSANT